MINNYFFNRTKTIVFLLFFLFSISAFAQQSNIKLDSLKISMHDVKLERAPSIQPDTLNFQHWVEVSIQFCIKGMTNLKTVELTFEKTKGAKDFKTFSLNYLKDASGKYLSFKGKRFPIKNSWATISQKVPKKLLRHKIFLSIYAIDRASIASNTLSLTVN